MNNQFNLWQITPYFLILILCFVIFQMWQNSKNEIEFNVRNDSLETLTIELTSKIRQLEIHNNELRTAIIVNEAGTVQQRNIYIQSKEKIKQQAVSQDYLETIQYLNNYEK